MSIHTVPTPKRLCGCFFKTTKGEAAMMVLEVSWAVGADPPDKVICSRLLREFVGGEFELRNHVLLFLAFQCYASRSL